MTAFHSVVFSFASEKTCMPLLRFLLETISVLDANFINIRDRAGRTVLHYAAKNTTHGPLLVKWLVEHGADPNIQDHKGYTPLHAAAEKPDRLPALLKLLALKAEPTLKTTNGWTPLMLASFHSNADAIHALMTSFPGAFIQGRLV